jgi:two-component system NtrC family response regulator
MAPPLRERRDDIPLLVAHFLNKFGEKIGRAIRELDPEVRDILCSYSWPGNVRELENVMERALVLSKDATITLDDLPPELRSTAPESDGNLQHLISWDKGLPETLEMIEAEMIRQAMKKGGNVQAQAAKMLGISRSNLQYKMKKYGLI